MTTDQLATGIDDIAAKCGVIPILRGALTCEVLKLLRRYMGERDADVLAKIGASPEQIAAFQEKAA